MTTAQKIQTRHPQGPYVVYQRLRGGQLFFKAAGKPSAINVEDGDTPEAIAAEIGATLAPKRYRPSTRYERLVARILKLEKKVYG